MLFCFVFQHLGKDVLKNPSEKCVLEVGAALVLCGPSGAVFLCSACWLLLRSAWVALGMPGSGRAVRGWGSFFLFFWAALFGPKMAAWILPKHRKTNGFRAIYAQRAARRKRLK